MINHIIKAVHSFANAFRGIKAHTSGGAMQFSKNENVERRRNTVL